MRKKLYYFFNLIYLSLLFSCVSHSQHENKKILFQDDFESYIKNSLPTGAWNHSGNGSITISNSKSVSGKQSVAFVSGEGYQEHAFLNLESIFPVKNNQYYGSMRMFVQEASPDGVHWTMLQSSGAVSGENYRSEVRYGGQHNKKLMANYETMGVASDCWQHSSVKIPEQEWFKVQWFFDGERDTMKFWLNDKLLQDISLSQQGQGCGGHDTNDLWHFPIFENLAIGWVDYQTGGGNRYLWIDDVILWQE